MIAFPEMLVAPAKKAGIPIPPNPDKYVKDEWPQFHLFKIAQLGQPIPSPTAPWENAKVIAKIKPEKCKTITFAQLKRKGFQVSISK